MSSTASATKRSSAAPSSENSGMAPNSSAAIIGISTSLSDQPWCAGQRGAAGARRPWAPSGAQDPCLIIDNRYSINDQHRWSLPLADEVERIASMVPGSPALRRTLPITVAAALFAAVLSPITAGIRRPARLAAPRSSSRPTGSNGGDGSEAAPFRTLEKARAVIRSMNASAAPAGRRCHRHAARRRLRARLLVRTAEAGFRHGGLADRLPCVPRRRRAPARRPRARR